MTSAAQALIDAVGGLADAAIAAGVDPGAARHEGLRFAAAIAECLPADLGRFAQEHPQIRISLEDLTSAEVQAAVADGRADVGVFAAPVSDARLRTWPYRAGELAVVLPHGHPLAVGEAALSFEALLDYDIVGLPIGASVHELMLQRALERGRSLNAA